MTFQVGDKAWYVPGYASECLIAIRVELQEHDYQYEGFWWVDEPVGHAISEDELFVNREDAEKELRSRWDNAPSEDRVPLATLTEYRIRTCNFIKGTWEETEKHPGFDSFPEKVEGIDWFRMT